MNREQIVITITILITITTIIVHTHYSEQNIIRTIHGKPIIQSIIKKPASIPNVEVTTVVGGGGGSVKTKVTKRRNKNNKSHMASVRTR